MGRSYISSPPRHLRGGTALLYFITTHYTEVSELNITVNARLSNWPAILGSPLTRFTTEVET
jgi:hypothetical protein